jgi:hypothetical protein
MNEPLRQLRKQYKNTPIPAEIDFVVKKALKQHKKKHVAVRTLAGLTAAVILVFAGINASPVLANTLSEVPVIGSLVKVITFREFKVDNGEARADIKVPAIADLENKTLQQSLNNKYLDENKKLYKNFLAEMEKLKQNGGGHIGVESGYVVKTDSDQILSVGRYVVNTVGSSSTTFKYDTVDKKNQLLITMPSLFKDDSYISLISENIKEQMKQQMQADSKKVYWIESPDSKMPATFKTISKEQNFYINNEGKLVISFDKYEVAPGYMGVLEFTIPTDVIANALVSKEYLK